jgi:hypothetical protein
VNREVEIGAFRKNLKVPPADRAGTDDQKAGAIHGPGLTSGG